MRTVGVAMDKTEARQILKRELGGYRSRSFAELVKLLDQEVTTEVSADSGVTYQLEIQVFWDDQPGGNLRVLGSIDDGGWRAFIPSRNPSSWRRMARSSMSDQRPHNGRSARAAVCGQRRS
jgi:hypothetical protein